MSNSFFTLEEGVTTRTVNRVIRSSIDQALDEFKLPGVVRDERREHRAYDKGAYRYVYGIGTPLRSTLVGHHVTGSGEFLLCFPNNYGGWDRTNTYDRLRVRIWDLILHNPPFIHDRMIEGRDRSNS